MKIILFILILSDIVLNFSVCRLLIPNDDLDATTDYQLLQVFVKKFIKQKVNILFNGDLNDPILKYFLTNIKIDLSICTDLTNLGFLLTHIIFIEEDFMTLRSTLNIIKQNEQWSGKNKMLVYFKKTLLLEDIKTTFYILWDFRILNSVLITNQTVYTWYPYKNESECGQKVVPVIVSDFSTDPFSDKIPTTFHGCKIKTMWLRTPVMVQNPFATRNGGVLTSILKLVSSGLNIEFRYMRNYTDDIRDAFRDRNIYKLREVMNRNQAEVSLWVSFKSNIYALQLEHSYFDFSSTMYTASVVLLLPPRIQIIGSFFIINMFHWYVQICLLATMVVVTIIWRFANSDSWAKSVFSITRISAIYTMQGLPTKVSGRILMISYCIFILILTVAHSSKLGSILTRPYINSSFATLEDVVDKNITIYSNIHFDAYNEMGMSEKTKQKLKNNIMVIRISLPEILRYYNKYPGTAVVTPKYMLNLYRYPFSVNVLKHEINSFTFSLAVRKGFHLLDPINAYLDRIHSAGLPEQYRKEIIWSTKKMNMVDHEGQRAGRLSVDHIRGALKLIVAGHFVAIAIFLFEIIFLRF